MEVNESADWNSGEINISPDNIDVSKTFIFLQSTKGLLLISQEDSWRLKTKRDEISWSEALYSTHNKQ